MRSYQESELDWCRDTALTGKQWLVFGILVVIVLGLIVVFS